MSFARDKGQKAKLYAAAGVPEYWVVDLNGREVLVHREPVDGVYQSITTYTEHQTLSPQAAPDHAIDLSSLFPPLDSQTP